MTWRSTGRTALELQENLTRACLLSADSAIQAAWGAVDRALFVPKAVLSAAYQDNPLQIGHGATISAPHMHAAQLSCLRSHLQPGARCLDVGSGTGIMVALMGMLVGPTGRVVGVEHIPELASWSLSNLHNMPASSGMGALLASQAVQVHVGDGRGGWATEAPYTCIHVGAAAPTLPAALVEQLAPGGRMVIPVGEEDQELLLVDKDEMGRLTQQRVMGVRFVPLCSKGEQVGGK